MTTTHREEMADALAAVKDWPRLVLYQAYHNKLFGRPGFWDKMTPNQLIQQWAAEYIRTKGLSQDARQWIISELNHQRLAEMFRGEQFSSVYTTYYLASAIAARKTAVEINDSEMVKEIDLYISAYLALTAVVSCPANSHRKVSQRMVTSGCRSGDKYGMDFRNDISTLTLLGKIIPNHWRIPNDNWKWEHRHPYMETEIILSERLNGRLPNYKPSNVLPPVKSRMVIERRQNGHTTQVDNLEKCAGFPVWRTEVRYNDGALASISHEDTSRKGKSAALMGGGPIPVVPFTGLGNLGRLLSSIEIGPGMKAGGGEREEGGEQGDGGGEGEKEEEREGKGEEEDNIDIEGGKEERGDSNKIWRHVRMEIDNGEIIVKVSPVNAEVRYLRRHK